MTPRISALSLLCLVMCGITGAARRPASERSWERYNILVERNIFARNRGRKREREPAETTVAPKPERYQVLAGVVQQGDEFIAFIEDSRGGTKAVRSGDEIAEGRVKTINLASIRFEQDGKTTTIKIGDSLQGGPRPRFTKDATRASGTAKDATKAAGSATPSAKPAAKPATSDSQAAILERLRQRRKKELGDQ